MTRDRDLRAEHKKAAALAAVAHVTDGMRIGLGTGSTARFAVDAIGERWRSGSLTGIACVATSKETARVAASYGLPLLPLSAVARIAIAIDGADEVDPRGNLIKGGGGALLLEKAVEKLAAKLIIVVDEAKLSPRLGTNFDLPVEVDPARWKSEAEYLTQLGSTPRLRGGEAQPFITEHGHYIVDCHFPEGITDPQHLAATLDVRQSVKAHGLFLDMTTECIVGSETGVRAMKFKPSGGGTPKP